MPNQNLKQQTKKGILWNIINQSTSFGLQFIVGIVMARMLTPEDYGITAIPTIFMVIANFFIDCGFAKAIVRKENATESDLSTAFIYSVTVGIICYIILFVSAPYIAEFYKIPILTKLIRITSLVFIWGPLATPQNIILQRRLDFKTPAIIAVVTKVIGATIGIIMAYYGYGLWSLAIMGLVSNLITFILTWIVVKWIPKKGWSKESFSYLWNYGNKMMLSGLIDTIYCNITPAIVGKFYSPTDLGVYNRASNYAELPAKQSTNIIQSVTFPVLSRMQNDMNALARNYRKMLKTTAFVEFPVMIMLAALAKPLIIILITEKWIESVIYLQMLCFAMMWYPIHAINLNLLQVINRSDLFLRLEIIKKCIGLTLMAVSLPFGLKYFVASGILGSIICLFVNTYYTGKFLGVGIALQMKDILPTLLLSMLMFLLVNTTLLVISNYMLQIFVGGSLGMLFYVGVSYIFKFKELEDVKYMIAFRRNK